MIHAKPTIQELVQTQEIDILQIDPFVLNHLQFDVIDATILRSL